MVFYSLFTIINNLFFIILLNDYYKRNYPEQYDSILITFFLKMVYLYSKIKITTNKYSNKLIELINSNVQLKEFMNNVIAKKMHNNLIYQVTDGIINTSPMYYITEKERYFEDKENSIYIFSDNENSMNNCINRVVFHSFPFSGVYEMSNIKFIMLEVFIQSNSYKLNLKSDTYNYYIVGNILDKNFFLYFLRNYHSYEAVNKDETWKTEPLLVKIIDENVNVNEYEITNTNYILIQKDSYNYCTK